MEHGGPPGWLEERLFERRVVLVSGRLDDALAVRAAAAIATLDAAGPGPIELHLDSPDGTLDAAFVLVDTLEAAAAPVRVRCRGDTGGPAIGILTAAAHRAASRHARFRLAQPAVRFSGTPDQIAAQARRHRDLLVRLQARLARLSGRPVDEIADDMRRGRYLDAEEAVAYGLIDTVLGAGS